jgi:hypothetical protein
MHELHKFRYNEDGVFVCPPAYFISETNQLISYKLSDECNFVSLISSITPLYVDEIELHNGPIKGLITQKST